MNVSNVKEYHDKEYHIKEYHDKDSKRQKG